MNVNGSGKCIPILCLESFQPENARYDWIPARCVYGNDFAGGTAILEFHSQWRVISNLLGDFHGTQRGVVASRAISEAELRTGDRVFRDLQALAVNDHSLVSSADADDVIGVAGRARCEEGSSQGEDKV